MKIHRIDIERDEIALTKPYAVAYESKDAVEMMFARIETDTGLVGYGAGTPSEAVTGEVFNDSFQTLTDGRISELVGCDPRAIGGLIRGLREQLPGRPAALATVEIALWDLLGKCLEQPLVDLFGRHHNGLLTSVTIGISSVEETLEDAKQHLANGFSCLKLKIGHDLELDLERIAKLRERVGNDVVIRVDANQGYGPKDAIALFERTRAHDIELIEQPMKPELDGELRELPEALRDTIAADESVQVVSDAWRLTHPVPVTGIFNIKLMKAGGIAMARDIARVAHWSNRSLMWGCMDESAISIAAALHVAYGSRQTRYLDLDGSFDLSRDLAKGGFEVRDGRLFLTKSPGLGVEVQWPT